MQTHEPPSDPLDFNESVRLKLPLRWALTIVAAIVAIVAAWSSIGADLRQSSRSQAIVERRVDALEAKFEAQREMLMEIRYDVKQIRSQRP